MKQFNFGIGLGAGQQFGNIQIGMVYHIGWIDLCNDELMYWKNNCLAITLTYLFKKRMPVNLPQDQYAGILIQLNGKGFANLGDSANEEKLALECRLSIDASDPLTLNREELNNNHQKI